MACSRRSALVLWFLFSWQTGAQAQCFLCDDIVEVNTETAQCFLENYEEWRKVSIASNVGRVDVDLSCADGAVEDERSGVLRMPDTVPDPLIQRVKVVYTLDTASLDCLKDLLGDQSISLDPKRVFDLLESCAS